MFNLILFGPPGSGKGTQSEKIISEFGLKHLGTGDLLRSEISRQTALGIEAKKFMDRGELVPDDVVIGMISSLLDANPNASGFLFDGFPRTTEQARALDKLLQFKQCSINVMLALHVEEDELVQRILLRGKTSGRSDDNDETVIRARIAEYRNKTEMVADHYRKYDKVVEINGVGSIEDIFEKIKYEISRRLQSKLESE